MKSTVPLLKGFYRMDAIAEIIRDLIPDGVKHSITFIGKRMQLVVNNEGLVADFAVNVRVDLAKNRISGDLEVLYDPQGTLIRDFRLERETIISDCPIKFYCPDVNNANLNPSGTVGLIVSVAFD